MPFKVLITRQHTDAVMIISRIFKKFPHNPIIGDPVKFSKVSYLSYFSIIHVAL